MRISARCSIWPWHENSVYHGHRVGDAVLTTGLLSWLVEQYPQAQFTIACGPYGADLFRAVPRLEKLIVMKKRTYNRHWLGLWRQCVGTKWDLIVDLRDSIVSRLLRAKKRVYYKRGKGQHKVIANAAVLGLNPPPSPHIWIDPQAVVKAGTLLRRDKPILALGPAANWAGKQWPVEHFVELVRVMTGAGGIMDDADIMVIADRHEREQIGALLQSIPDQRRIEIIGQDLQTAAACLQQARLFIGNDSGLMHLSAALGTPTLGMFGPGFPDIYRPWGERCAFVCTPESREELFARQRAAGRDINLMQTLSVERVVEAAEGNLKRTGG